MSDYKKGYRDGVMAERKRAILVALRARNGSTPSHEGLQLAHQIGRAGDQIPSPAESIDDWSVFGERRFVRDLPTFLECKESPFTSSGKKYIARLESRHKLTHSSEDLKEFLGNHEDQYTIRTLQESLAYAPTRIKELEEIVRQLINQLDGVSG